MNHAVVVVCAKCQGGKCEHSAIFSVKDQRWTFHLGNRKRTLFCDRSDAAPLKSLQDKAADKFIPLCDTCMSAIHWAHALYDGFTASDFLDSYHSPPCDDGW